MAYLSEYTLRLQPLPRAWPTGVLLSQLSGTGSWWDPEQMRVGGRVLRAIGNREGGMNQTLGGVLVPPQACLFCSSLSPFASTDSYQPPSAPSYYGEFPGSSWGKTQGPEPRASCLSRSPSYRGQRVRRGPRNSERPGTQAFL